MDEDLNQMTREELIDEAKKLRHGIRQHRDSSRHELCWHHPSLWGQLPEKTDPIPVVPEWPEFIRGCVRYRQSLDEQAPHAPRTNEPYESQSDRLADLLGNHKPEDWPRLFEQHLNAGDLEAVVGLYDPNASFVPQSGETVVGRDGIRDMLAELIRMKARLHGRVMKVVTAGDVALLYTDWQGTTVDPSGKTVEIHHEVIELVRRQPDGPWKLIVGDPNGRG